MAALWVALAVWLVVFTAMLHQPLRQGGFVEPVNSCR